MEKSAEDIILHMCTKTHNHMRYSSQIQSERHNFLPFTPPPPNNPENQNYEKMKNACGDVIILDMCTKNHVQMMYAS